MICFYRASVSRCSATQESRGQQRSARKERRDETCNDRFVAGGILLLRWVRTNPLVCCLPGYVRPRARRRKGTDLHAAACNIGGRFVHKGSGRKDGHRHDRRAVVLVLGEGTRRDQSGSHYRVLIRYQNHTTIQQHRRESRAGQCALHRHAHSPLGANHTGPRR
jgi:hypothetical protein